MGLSVPPLPAGRAIVDKNGQPTLDFTVYWQQVIGGIVTAVNALTAAQAAQAAADAIMPDIAPLTIYADHTGTVQTGQLPRNVPALRYNGVTNVTTSSTWSFVVVSGGITATIGAATGVFNITALTSTAVVTITSVYAGITKSRTLVVTKAIGTAPAGTGGGTTATDNTFTSFNLTSMSTVSDELTVLAGTAGQVQLSAPLEVGTDATIGSSYRVFGIWQWDSTGAGVWVDLGTEVQSNPDASVEAEVLYLGALSVSHTKTGLIAGSSHKFRLRARRSAFAGVRNLYGTASAVGS